LKLFYSGFVSSNLTMFALLKNHQISYFVNSLTWKFLVQITLKQFTRAYCHRIDGGYLIIM